MCGQAGGEDQVGSTGGEAEACTEAGVVGDDGEDAVQSSIDNIQGEAEEHEAELERLGNAADEGADSSGNNQTDSSLLVLGSLDHGQSSTGNAEHHAGEEAGHVHAEVPIDTILTGDIASPVVAQVAQTDGVEPEHVVQSVMQAGGDQQTVQEGIQANTEHAHALDAVADGNQNAEDDGPDKQQDGGNNDGNKAGHNGDGTLATEECQHIRQLGVLELVVAGGANNAAQDTDEGVSDLSESNLVGLAGDHVGGNDADSANGQQGGDHQPADQTSQTGSAVIFFCQANGNADAKQQSHVVDQSAAGLDQEETDGVQCAGSRCIGNAHNTGSNGVAQTHQDAADGQNSNGKEQSLTELLKIFHHRKFPPNFVFSLIVYYQPSAHDGK